MRRVRGPGSRLEAAADSPSQPWRRIGTQATKAKSPKRRGNKRGRDGWEQLAMVRLQLYLSSWITVRSTYIHCPINQGSTQRLQAPFFR